MLSEFFHLSIKRQVPSFENLMVYEQEADQTICTVIYFTLEYIITSWKHTQHSRPCLAQLELLKSAAWAELFVKAVKAFHDNSFQLWQKKLQDVRLSRIEASAYQTQVHGRLQKNQRYLEALCGI